MPKDHLVQLRAVFQKLKEVGLKLKPSKCKPLKKSLMHLGDKISESGIKTDDSKIKVIQDWPTPKTITEARSFLGFTNYYQQLFLDMHRSPNLSTVQSLGRVHPKRTNLLCWMVNVRRPLGI